MKKLAILSAVASLAAFGWGSSALAADNIWTLTKNSQRIMMELTCDDAAGTIRTFLTVFTQGGGPAEIVRWADRVVYEGFDHVPSEGAPTTTGFAQTIGDLDTHNLTDVVGPPESPRTHNFAVDGDANSALIKATVYVRVRPPSGPDFTLMLDDRCGVTVD